MLLELLILLILLQNGESSFRLINQEEQTITWSEKGLLLYNDGTFCNRGFSNKSAHAICKEMGYLSFSHWHSGSLIWPSVQQSYPVTVTGNYECNHTDDVFLRCNGTTVSCDPGTFRVPSSSGGWNCSLCPPNKYKSHKGVEPFCSNCPSNTVSNSDRTFCVCPTGTFWKEPNCMKCPTTASSVPGSKNCNCPAGSSWEGTTCLSCPEGTASPGGALQCRKCPIGSVVLDNGKSCSCPAESVWKWEEQSWGSCDDSQSATVWLLVLGSVIGVTVITCLVLGWLLYREKRRWRRRIETAPAVSFNTTAGEIAQQEEELRREEEEEEGRRKHGWVGEEIDGETNSYAN